jgi:hypothetical protein
MKRRAFAIVAAVLVLGLMPGPALAASIVDQGNEGQNLKTDGGHDLAQTVTVGQTGRLTGVDLFLYSANGWTDAVSIQTIDRVTRLPTGSKLASATISVFGEKWYHIEFPTPVSLIAGGRFAIVLSQGTWCSWSYSSGTYSRGEALEYGSAWTNLQGDASLDFFFRTYMDNSPAPTATPQSTSDSAPVTPTPKITPTPKVTPTPTQKPISTPTANPSSAASVAASNPSGSAAAASSTTSPAASSTTSPTTSSPSASPSAQSGPQSGGSGDSGGPPILIIIVGILALAAVLGSGIGLGLVLARRRQRS